MKGTKEQSTTRQGLGTEHHSTGVGHGAPLGRGHKKSPTAQNAIGLIEQAKKPFLDFVVELYFLILRNFFA